MEDPYATAEQAERRFRQWCADNNISTEEADAELRRAIRALQYEQLPDTAPRDPCVLAREWLIHRMQA